MAYALVLCPLFFALFALVLPSDRLRPWLLPVGGALQGALTSWPSVRAAPSAGGWLLLDPARKLGCSP